MKKPITIGEWMAPWKKPGEAMNEYIRWMGKNNSDRILADLRKENAGLRRIIDLESNTRKYKAAGA